MRFEISTLAFLRVSSLAEAFSCERAISRALMIEFPSSSRLVSLAARRELVSSMVRPNFWFLSTIRSHAMIRRTERGASDGAPYR